MKPLHRTIFVAYFITLLWLILFKFSYDIFGVISDYQTRSINLVPLAGSADGSLRGMIDNCLAFLPLGLLLGVNFRQITFWRKLAFAFFVSLGAEVIQYTLAIGAADIDDLLMNTLGGLLGLGLYGLACRYISRKWLDLFVSLMVAVLLVLLLVLRVFVFKVKY